MTIFRSQTILARYIVTVAGVVMICGGARGAHAQDLEMTAQVMGRRLPDAYYQTIREKPDFFEIARGWTAKTALAAANRQAVTGTLPMAVVLALFSDSPEPAFSRDDVQRVLFDGPATYGTLTEFYTEISGARLSIAGTVTPWVRTAVSRQEAVGTSSGLQNAGDYLGQALALADETTDFASFDNDGPDGVPNSGDDDGFVDAVAIQFLEIAASCGGSGIWPHRSRISNWTGNPFETNDLTPSGDPIYADDYIVQSTVSCNGIDIQTASTIAHEMGHMLGLPDLYDNTEGTLPTLRNWVVGCWSLMAAGAWGCGNSVERTGAERPPHYGPWEKMMLGWLSDLRTVGEVQDQELVLPPVRGNESVLRIPLSSTEYLLVEYRDGTGFDQNLPAAGVLVYHVDENRTQRPCRSCDRLYHVALLEADGNDALVRLDAEGGNRGEVGDVFATNGPDRLTNATSPSTRLSSGAASDVTLYSIAVEDGLARIHLSTTVIALFRLLVPFLPTGAEALTATETAYLDRMGNDNGRYDLGDIRAYLLTHPSSATTRTETGSNP